MFTAARWLVLATLLVTPLVLGCVRPWCAWPFLAVCYSVGLASLLRAVAVGSSPPLPGRWALLALHVLIAAQTVPLPRAVLERVSPGTLAFYAQPGQPPNPWASQPVAIDPSRTASGLLVLGGLSLLYGAAFREFTDPRWQRRLAWTLALSAVLVAAVGLVHNGLGAPRIYGRWGVSHVPAMFAPFPNRILFGGYLILSLPSLLSLFVEGWLRLQRQWQRRERLQWLVLLEEPGAGVLRLGALALFVFVALVACQSRSAPLALALAGVAVALAGRGRRGEAKATIPVLVLGAAAIAGWLLLDGRSRLVQGSEWAQIRLKIWSDMLRAVPHFPLGAGVNNATFSASVYQRHWDDGGHVPHNEFLKLLLETGPLGLACGLWLTWTVVRASARAAARDRILAGFAVAVIASTLNSTVQFMWPFLAHLGTFAVLCGVVVASASETGGSGGRRAPSGLRVPGDPARGLP